jgi:hypothetical protein
VVTEELQLDSEYQEDVPKQGKNFVGIERSVTFKTPLVDFRRTKYYRVVKRKC